MPYAGIKCVAAPAQSNAAHVVSATQAKKLGATHYRYAFEIGWGLEALDSVVGTCKTLGLKMVLCVFRADRIIPTDLAGAQAFAAKTVELLKRTQGLATHVEVWNEPNHKPFVVQQNPVAFAQLMVETHKAVKAALPSVVTITGGLSPEPSPYAPHEFFAACCKANPKFVWSFDLVGYHPYCFPHSPLGSESWNAMLQAVTLWKATRTAYGRVAEFAATEFGAPSAWKDFNEAKQAQWISDYFKAFASRGPVWRLAGVFTAKDGNIGTGAAWEPSTGMYRGDLGEKPAANVFRIG